MLQNYSVISIATFHQKLQPIFTFGAFLQSDMQSCNEVRFTVSIKGFPDIGTNTRTGTD